MTDTTSRTCANQFCPSPNTTIPAQRRFCCDRCRRQAANQRYYRQHRKKVLARQATYALARRESKLQYLREWRKANRARLLASKNR